MVFVATSKIVGRLGGVKKTEKFNRISVAVNYQSKGKSFTNWFDIFDFDHFFDSIDESCKGKIVSLNCYIRPTISKVGDVNVHNYLLVLSSIVFLNKDGSVLED